MLPKRLAILTYHRVLPRPDVARPGVPDAIEFDWHLRTVRRWFNVLPLADAVERLQTGGLPPRALCITFDDGYADNHDVAMPALQSHGLTATFFVASGYLDGGAMWNDDVIDCVAGAEGPVLDLTFADLGAVPVGDPTQRQAAVMLVINAWKRLPGSQRAERVAQLRERYPLRRSQRLMMQAEQVAALKRGGMEVGAHTVSHPILTRQTIAKAREEIAGSRAALEEITGAPITGFAYPNGRPGKDYAAEHVSAVREAGFSYAVSTAWGTARAGVDQYQLPRIAPWDATPARFTARILRALYLQSEGVSVPSPAC